MATTATMRCSAARATTTPCRSSCCARRSTGSSRRRSTSRSGVGGHVDHQLCREAGVRLLQDGRRWVMPGPDYAGIVTFYEDFPYAWWNEFRGLSDLGANPFAGLPGDVSLRPEFADITDQIERKIMGIDLYHEPDRAPVRRHPRDGRRHPGLRTGDGRARRRRWRGRTLLGIRPRLRRMTAGVTTGRWSRREVVALGGCRAGRHRDPGRAVADLRAARRPGPVRRLGPCHRHERPRHAVRTESPPGRSRSGR